MHAKNRYCIQIRYSLSFVPHNLLKVHVTLPQKFLSPDSHFMRSNLKNEEKKVGEIFTILGIIPSGLKISAPLTHAVFFFFLALKMSKIRGE